MTIATSSMLLILQQAQPGAGGFIVSLLPLIIIFGVFYLLVIRPQARKQRQAQMEREAMLNALKPGDKVVTAGGIFGTIVSVRDQSVQLRIAQSVSIEVERNAIARLSDAKDGEAAK